ncbi:MULTISPECIES: (Na+)-NQR maturation NqrM [Marinobacter]|uniref:(Na+)-NQR maturation NqrM n=1 Tax=Marinobacter suaedae TaxID=3057675 RepID=A0ABT8VW30_9GAMM|nr:MULTISPECIES: (Na+)-NQR maturation NqrM [unclassified Marinobacter]MBZ2168304.1 (Na+)-NQR maturation NqrM [Marinobacter sp. F4216]MDO3720200.1 (Na+)-NQR maturation NqrM [Marinobacter sp. chi1]
MGTFLLVLFIVVLLVAAMSVGVIFGRKPIKGTCGGIGALGISQSCDICGGNTQKCEEENERVAREAGKAEPLAYDASKPDNG